MVHTDSGLIPRYLIAWAKSFPGSTREYSQARAGCTKGIKRDEHEKLQESRWDSQGASDCRPAQSRTRQEGGGRKTKPKRNAKRTVGIIEATKRTSDNIAGMSAVA